VGNKKNVLHIIQGIECRVRALEKALAQRKSIVLNMRKDKGVTVFLGGRGTGLSGRVLLTTRFGVGTVG
jgi:hypothetical protein